MQDTEIILYGTAWCGDCKLARLVLDKLGVPYTDIDIDENPEMRQAMMELNGGLGNVPTIVFPDGSLLIEPSRDVLQNKLKELALS